jgi:ATP-dependent exoDNAse (exonuclease V) alpha subunit
VFQRDLLYTAVTGARKLAVMVGNPKPIAMAVINMRGKLRHTILRHRLTMWGET